MKRPVYVIIILIFTIITLIIVRITISNRLSTNGMELGKIQQEIVDYKNQNTLLEEKVLEASSLVHVADQAKRLGFVQEKAPVYISAPLPLALR